MSFRRSSTNLSTQGWMQNSSDRVQGVKNTGTSHLVGQTNSLRSSFGVSQNGHSARMPNGSSPFNVSGGRNLGNEQFKFPQANANHKFASSFSLGTRFDTSSSRFESLVGNNQEQSVHAVMSVANSFHGSTGSSKGSGRSAQQAGNKFATSFCDLSSSVRFRRSQNAASIASRPADLNSFVPSLNSFGQIKLDYLSVEAAKKRFQNSRR
uniref:Uncharacterized protein n=1 Tax=Ditylenchus dipsaci TaxID=166011 RepID=A0A915E409_9BILA